MGKSTQEHLQQASRTFESPSALLTPKRNEFCLKTVSNLDVLNRISNLPSNKAHGHDNIDIRSLKSVAPTISSSIARLINLSIATACVPDTWKTSITIPAYKVESKENIKYYRPISLLSLLSKLLEKAICKQIVDFLETSKILCKFFSGFRK